MVSPQAPVQEETTFLHVPISWMLQVMVKVLDEYSVFSEGSGWWGCHPEASASFAHGLKDLVGRPELVMERVRDCRWCVFCPPP